MSTNASVTELICKFCVKGRLEGMFCDFLDFWLAQCVRRRFRSGKVIFLPVSCRHTYTFLFFGVLLVFYSSVNIDDTSSLWVGAWWLGFLMGGIVVIALAFPVLFLPRQLPHTTHVRLDREKEMHQGLDATKIRHFGSANR